MGDMADFALDQVVDTEIERAQLYYDGTPDEDGEYVASILPELDIGITDLNSIGQVIEIASLQLNTRECSYVGLKSEVTLTKKLENKLKTVKYLKSFALFYKNRGVLSNKQKDIINTNWKGGAKDFINCVEHKHVELSKTFDAFEAATLKWLSLKGT